MYAFVAEKRLPKEISILYRKLLSLTPTDEWWNLLDLATKFLVEKDYKLTWEYYKYFPEDLYVNKNKEIAYPPLSLTVVTKNKRCDPATLLTYLAWHVMLGEEKLKYSRLWRSLINKDKDKAAKQLLTYIKNNDVDIWWIKDNKREQMFWALEMVHETFKFLNKYK